jgi:hypothetical protein
LVAEAEPTETASAEEDAEVAAEKPATEEAPEEKQS